MDLTGVLTEATARIATGFRPSSFARRPGQTTIEYLLLLAVVGGMAAMMAVLFHRRIMGGLFTLVGMIIGAGQPK